MRIAFVVTEYVTEKTFAGGLANYTYRVARGLRSLGHEAEIFVNGGPEKTFEHDGILVHRINVHNRLLYAFKLLHWQLRSMRILNVVKYLQTKLNKRHSERPFDLVHYTHLIGTGAIRSRIPTVVRLSSYRDLWIPFGFKFTCCFERFLEDLALKRADAVFAPSEWVADCVRSKLNVPVKVIESPFVPPSGDEDPTIMEKYVSRDKKPYGLYFGSLAEWKGVFVLSKALRNILAKYDNLHFLFVGDDISVRDGKAASEYIMEELKGFNDRVTRFNALPHTQLFPIIRNAEFVVLPSLADNFPNACIEAMSLGKVVIGSRGCGFEQLIEDRANGFLCEPGDTTSLINLLNRTITMSKNDKEQMGKRAMERINALAPEKVVLQLVKFYEDVINRVGKRGSISQSSSHRTV